MSVRVCVACTWIFMRAEWDRRDRVQPAVTQGPMAVACVQCGSSGKYWVESTCLVLEGAGQLFLELTILKQQRMGMVGKYLGILDP